MARIRSVHPGFFTDESLVELDAQTLLLLIGLWTECDDQGVFEWRPVRLKMRLFPVANIDMPSRLGELAAANAIRKVELNGVEYGLVRNFRRFQRPKSPNAVHPMCADWGNYVGLTRDKGETPPHSAPSIPQNAEAPPVEPPSFPEKGPPPPQMEDGGDNREDEGKDEEDLTTTDRVERAAPDGASRQQEDFDVSDSVQGSEGPEGAGYSTGEAQGDNRQADCRPRGGKAVRRASDNGRGTRLPDDWQPTDEQLAFATAQGLDPVMTALRFRNHWHSKSGGDAFKRKWAATWENWCTSPLEQQHRANGQQRESWDDRRVREVREELARQKREGIQ